MTSTFQRDTLKQIFKSNPFCRDEIVWIGANDVQTEGVTRWVDSKVATTEWKASQPSGGTTENCMAFAGHSKMADKNCTASYKYLCEKAEGMYIIALHLLSLCKQYAAFQTWHYLNPKVNIPLFATNAIIFYSYTILPGRRSLHLKGVSQSAENV